MKKLLLSLVLALNFVSGTSLAPQETKQTPTQESKGIFSVLGYLFGGAKGPQATEECTFIIASIKNDSDKTIVVNLNATKAEILAPHETWRIYHALEVSLVTLLTNGILYTVFEKDNSVQVHWAASKNRDALHPEIELFFNKNTSEHSVKFIKIKIKGDGSTIVIKELPDKKESTRTLGFRSPLSL